VGSEANADKIARCQEQVHALGAHLDERAPVRARLELSSQNRLRIRSSKQGVVLNEPLGHDVVPDLCTEVTTRALSALAHEPKDG
jgi:hypothetical protein